jgi:hypothetical protein
MALDVLVCVGVFRFLFLFLFLFLLALPILVTIPYSITCLVVTCKYIYFKQDQCASNGQNLLFVTSHTRISLSFRKTKKKEEDFIQTPAGTSRATPLLLSKKDAQS